MYNKMQTLFRDYGIADLEQIGNQYKYETQVDKLIVNKKISLA